MPPPRAFSVPKRRKKVGGVEKKEKKNKIASQRKTHPPPAPRFLYLRETKSWWCEGGGGEEGEEGEEGEGEEKVHLLTHATARGMGKKSVC